jgi:predicted PurR-regulated permease PerM
MQRQELSYRAFLAYAALAVGVVLVPVLIWQLGSILLLGFAAILIAVLLHVVSDPLQRWTPLPIWADLLIAGVILLGVVAFGAWILGSQISAEFSDVATRGPRRGGPDSGSDASEPGGPVHSLPV